MQRTILVDMDGVLVDLLPTWLRVYGELVDGDDYIHPDTITEYGHERFVSYPEIFWEALGPALEQASPTRGSYAFNDVFHNNEYDVQVVTYAHHSAPNAHRTKLEWLERYFPYFSRHDKVTFTKDKYLVRGDVLIEDNPEHITNWLRANPLGWAIIINQPYNDSYSSPEGRCIRAADFGEVPDILKAIFEQQDKEEFYASK